MAHSAIPSIHLQPPSVDFIDNRLPNIHDVFRHRDDVRFDPVLQKYVQNHHQHTVIDEPDAGGSRGNNGQVLTQPHYTFGDIGESEKFWGLIFFESMKKFIHEYPNEPKMRDKSGYSIRTQTTWNGVNEQLHKAREAYDGTRQGFRGRCKRVFRKIGHDAAEPVQNMIRVMPDIDYVSPVLGAVQLLLNAFTAASSVRDQVTLSLDDRNLEDLFGDVEVFLITFPDMSKIQDAAVSLVVSVMKAVEDAIGFFISHQVFRAASAFSRGKSGYQKPLLESLGAIQTRSQKLIHQAQNAHFISTQVGLKAIWDDTGRLVMSQHHTGQAIEYLIDKVDRVHREGAQFFNTVNRLLMDAEESKKARDLSLQNKIASLEEKIASLEGSSRASTPATPELSPMWSNQNTSWAGYQPQLGPLWPSYQHAWPASFIPQEAVTGSLLNAHSYSYLPANPFYHPQHPLLSAPSQVRSVSSARLLDLFSAQSDLDEADLNRVKDYSHRIPRKFRARAEQVVQTLQFRNWIVTPSPRRLLIHGELPRQSLMAWHISPLSHFCAMLVRMLRAQGKYVVLVFFCGCHTEQEDGNVGSLAMMRSLLEQLLRQVSFESAPLDETIDLDRLGRNDCNISQLCDLFVFLIHSQLRKDYTLICIMDGVGHYETDELEPDLLFTMKSLLRLSKETSLENGSRELSHGDVKILVTTPYATDPVQRLFEDESDGDEMSFLSMSGFPDINDHIGMRMSGSFLSNADSGADDLDDRGAVTSLIDSDDDDDL